MAKEACSHDQLVLSSVVPSERADQSPLALAFTREEASPPPVRSRAALATLRDRWFESLKRER
jgi:hypothetical protein